MRIGITLVLLVMLAIGVGTRMTRMDMKDPLNGEYEYSPLRTVILTSSRDARDMVAPLRQWAESDGYTFRVSSPAGEPGSILFQIWKGEIAVEGGDRLGTPGLEFGIYCGADTVDGRALDDAAEGLRATLALFGTVEVNSAPPGTLPRKEAKFYRERP